jgi:hypothetical protein
MVEMSSDAFGNLARSLAAGDPCAVVRTIRGRKSRTVASFFDESAAALQFPPYFGENWNAFDEMIVDLDWLAGDAYLLLVTDAELLLVDADTEDFRILSDIMSRARLEWLTPNQYIPRNRRLTPFHVLLHTTSDASTSALARRLSQAGASFDMITASSVA